jgi:hypothetical protein
MQSMFPEGKSGLSMKVIAGAILAVLYSLGLVNATNTSEQEIIKIKVEMGVIGNKIENIEGDIREIKQSLNPQR